jgi:hypothetical protein
MRRTLIGLAGGGLLLLGAAMLILPGPGIPVVLAAIALLATEFPWARSAWHRVRRRIARLRRRTGIATWLRSRKRIRTAAAT